MHIQNKENKIHIGQLIKKYRNEHGISMEEFAKRAGISKGYVGMLEKNYNPKTGKEIIPTTKTVECVAKAFGVPVTDVYAKINSHVIISKEDQEKAFEKFLKDAQRDNFKIPDHIKNWKDLFEWANPKLTQETDTYKEENIVSHSLSRKNFEYTHIPVGISAGVLENIEGLIDLPRVSIPDFCLGKYARNPRVVIMHVNGESMNRVIENGAMIAVMTGIEKEQVLDGDIVVACVGPSYTVKRFYNSKEKKSIFLSPDSTDPTFVPIIIPYDSPDSLRIFGKVVMYNVIL